jgi:glycosyltransferase involved in cell wall biosynthesis
MTYVCEPTRVKICHIIDHLNLHGAQVYLAKLVRGLSERGFSQRVYGLNDPRHEQIIEMMTGPGVTVETIGKKRLLSGHGLVKLYVDLLKWRPDIMQTCLRFSDYIGRVIGRLAGVPLNVSLVTQPNVDKHRWQFWLDRMTAGLVDRVIFNSTAVIPFGLSREGIKADQAVYIPNGIEIDKPSCPGIGLAIRSQLGVPSGGTVVGCVARLYPQKGHVYLLSAFKKVLEEEPNVFLLLVGDGPLRPELEAQVSTLGICANVRFLGERDDLADVFDSIDLFVQASIWEGMSIALMQAMLCGKTVVATRVDGTAEIIEDQKTGILVDPASSDALAAGIIRLLRDPDLSQRMAQRSRELIRRDFAVEKMVSKFDTMYKELLQRT